mmetsp:Transcript_19828/g.66678  ORF Transcript_19828/g.66678 Transcript_19828/m.66678 type:complete len:387 (+) Transcript_19828:290-1450(+)
MACTAPVGPSVREPRERVLRERLQEEEHLARVLHVERGPRGLAAHGDVEGAPRGRRGGERHPGAGAHHVREGRAGAGDGRGEHVLVRVVVPAAEHKVRLAVVLHAQDGVRGGPFVDRADAHLHRALGRGVHHGHGVGGQLLCQLLVQLLPLVPPKVRVRVVVAPDGGGLLPARVGAVGARCVPVEDLFHRRPPLGRVHGRHRALPAAAAVGRGARGEAQVAELRGEAEAVDVAQDGLHVRGAPAGEHVHVVGRVRGERTQAVEHSGRGRLPLAREVLVLLEVADHVVLGDEGAVEAEEKHAAARGAVGAHDALHIQFAGEGRRWRGPRAARNRRGRVRAVEARLGALRVGDLHALEVLHEERHPAGGGVGLHEGHVLAEALVRIVP